MKEDIVELLHTREMEWVWKQVARVLKIYFRVQTTGVKNIPKSGPVIIAPNHSGVAGFDQVVLAHVLRTKTKRPPVTLAHRAYFDFSPMRGRLSESFGLRKASLETGHNCLKQNKLLVLFPEGERGNFKSSTKAYHLQKFRTGFLRLAIMNKAPIVPCTIVGAEESHLNLGNIDLSRFMKDIRIPIPLNLIPLPAKWKIRFWDPIDPSRYPLELANQKNEIEKSARMIRRLMQIYLHQELKRRKYVYFPFLK